jgi:diaminohydroxyphosphoribosylaminopyrimidine deaminase/5-amino-6-(5-phosphoribosylamino)uracil reductase
MSLDEKFMQRALDLAELGRGNVSPNPMVGCVIVHDDKIIGEGWHERFGGPHAEVNAFHDVQNKALLHEATVYVTLEPCSHYGKTPPCVDLIITYNPKRVVICNEDPNPLVSGDGISKLKEMQIVVDLGTLKEKGRELNKRFFTFQEKQRPYIILKWAETADRFIARENFDSKWISGEKSRIRVHKWRTEEDAIIVGTNTAKYDNPMLTARDVKGENPIRVVLDRSLKLKKGLNLFDQSEMTLVYNGEKDEEKKNLEHIKIDFEQNIIIQILDDMHARGIQSLIVEGGNQLLKSFIDIGMWDEARVFQSPKKFETGISAPLLFSPIVDNEMIEEDELITYKNI